MIEKSLKVDWTEYEEYPSGGRIAPTTREDFVLDQRSSEWMFLKGALAQLDFLKLQKMLVNSIIKKITSSVPSPNIVTDGFTNDGTSVFMEDGSFVQPITLGDPTINNGVLTVVLDEYDDEETIAYSIDKQNYQSSPDFNVSEGDEYDIRAIYPNRILRTVASNAIPMMSFNTKKGVID